MQQRNPTNNEPEHRSGLSVWMNADFARRGNRAQRPQRDFVESDQCGTHGGNRRALRRLQLLANRPDVISMPV
jgi:hypothetical protein